MSRVDPGHPGAKPILWGDASYAVQKARDANVFTVAKQSAIDFPNVFAVDADVSTAAAMSASFGRARQLTHTKGARLAAWSPILANPEVGTYSQ